MLALLLAVALSDPSAFVRSLYENDQRGGPDPVFSVKSREELRRTFDGPIVDRIWRDLVDAQGEVGRMDAHYLYDAQDNEVKNLNVRIAASDDVQARVLATWEGPSGKGSAEFHLRRTKDGWRVANIVYPKGNYLQYLEADFPAPTIADERAENAVCAHYENYRVTVPEDWDAETDSVELAEMFANGEGVERDFSAAIHFVCRMGMASAERWSMLEHVLSMERGLTDEPLDFCEFNTSRDGGIICAGRRDDEEGPQQKRRFEAVRARFAGPTLDVLRVKARAFVEADAFWEAEQSRGGTMYVYAETHATLDREGRFLDQLELYTKERAAAATPAELAQADAELNAAYKKRLAGIEPCDPEYSNCTPPLEPENLREAQRAWIPYRDAWIAFYQERWRGTASPAVLRVEIATALTRSRIPDLR
jgi:uncharacterized protein YecT (DUF1311 family)